MEKRSSVQDSSLSLASDGGGGGGGGGEAALQPHVPQVPQLVSACIRHIETHGLHTVGIFRVSSSKKRARQVRPTRAAGGRCGRPQAAADTDWHRLAPTD